MPLFIGRVASILGVIVLLFLVVWMAIGRDWRALLSDPPKDTDILFWSQSQRDTGFRMLDRIPFIAGNNSIPSGEEKPLPEGDPFVLDFEVSKYITENRHSAIVVLHKGSVRLEEYGLDFSAEGRWTSFSVGKSLTSTLIGAAIKDGYIESVDEPVTKYIQALSGSAYDDVTIEQLLTMTSGVAWNEDYEDPTSDVALFANHEPEDGLPQIVSYMRGLGRAHEPGKVWNYSTGETNLVGILLGNAIEKPIATYLSEKIWTPYGMGADASWLLGLDGNELSGCCIQAATRDMARFGQFMLDGGVIDGVATLPSDWIDNATRKHVDETGPAGRGYGYQWWVYDGGAFAAIGIFGQGILIDPSRDLVIAVNSSWQTAEGFRTGENERRTTFYRQVQEAIDREISNG
ncbi:MAG: serine hydrolase [Pseudomonadota bacterium]